MPEQTPDSASALGSLTAAAPTPAELDALVQHERQVIVQLAAFLQLVDLHELRPVSVRATAPPSCHPESESCEEEGSPAYIQRQLLQISPGSRPLAKSLINQAAQGTPSALTEAQLNAQLQDQSFPHWLHFAVQDLVPEAQAVVIQEMWEHYHYALEKHITAEGEVNGHGQALREMGSSGEVRKRLDEVHITKGEASIEKLPMPRLLLMGMAMNSPVLAYMCSWVWGWGIVLFGVFSVILMTALFAKIPKLSANARTALRWKLWIGITHSLWMFSMAYKIATDLESSEYLYYLSLLVSLIVLTGTFLHFELARRYARKLTQLRSSRK